MTILKKILFFILSLLPTAYLAARRTVTSAGITTPQVDEKIFRLGDEYRDIKHLVEKAQREAEALKRKAAREIEGVEKKIERRKQKLEKKRAEVLRKEESRFERTHQRAQEELESIRKKAERDALKLVQEAEMRALDLRDKLDAQDKEDRKKSVVAITAQWREGVIKEFKEDTDFIKTIVMRGEVSRRERDNFVILFDEQLAWFKKKVAAVVSFFDETYKVVVAKKNALNVLVDAQRQADEIIADLSLVNHLAVKVSDQLRVLALYEINNHLREHKASDVYMSAEAITRLVSSVTKTISPEKRVVKIVTEKDTIEKLKEQVASLETQLDGSQKHVQAVEKRSQRLLAKMQKEKEAIAERVRKEQKDALTALSQKVEGSDEEIGELRSMLSQMHTHVATIKQQYRAEKSRMKFLAETREKEKEGLVAQLKKVNAQIEMLQGYSAEKLAELGAEITGQHVREANIVAILENKNRQKSELEFMIAKISAQLEEAERFAQHSYKAAHDLAQDLSKKQADNLKLEIALEKIKQQLSMPFAMDEEEELVARTRSHHQSEEHDHVHEPDDDGAEFEVVADDDASDEDGDDAPDEDFDGDDGFDEDAQEQDEQEESEPFQETMALLDDDEDEDDEEVSDADLEGHGDEKLEELSID